MTNEPSGKTQVHGPSIGCFLMKLVGGLGLIAVLALAKGLAKFGAKGADDVIKAVGKSADEVGRAVPRGAAEVAPASPSGPKFGNGLAHGAARGAARGAQRGGQDDDERQGAQQPEGVQP